MYHFITIIDENSQQKVKNLKESCEKWNCDLTILTTYDKRLGNYSKIIKISEYLQSQSYNDSDIIFITDAFDCVMVDYPQKTLDYFNQIGCDVLISTEVGYNRWSHCPIMGIKIFDKYSKSKSVDYRGLCAGALCGRANKLKEFFLDMVKIMPELVKEISLQRWKTLACVTGCNHLRPFPDWVLKSDQYYMSFYLAKIDFINYTKIKIDLDVYDKIFFNYHYDVENLVLNNYVFVHVFALKEAAQMKRWHHLLKLASQTQP